MRQLKLAILAAIALLYAGNPLWEPESISEPPLSQKEKKAQRKELPYHTYRNAWHATALRDIRRDYLLDELGVGYELALRIAVSSEKEALNYAVSTDRVLSIIIVESYGNPHAVSHAGAVGLMQIIPTTGRFVASNLGKPWEGPRILKEVGTNISFGTWYYSHLLRQFGGDDRAALAAYNWGPQRIINRQMAGMPLPQVYPRKVYAAERELREELYNEYETRFWRGFDLFVNRARKCINSGRSQIECGLEWPFIPDGKGLLSGDREGVLSAD